MKIMDAKTKPIVMAAWAMFQRYGYAKTTMSDIAAEAGVARQTLYNAFPGKPDILRAVIVLAGEVALEEIKTAWDSCANLEEKIDSFQRLGPLAWFEAMRQMPDWAELMEGINAIAADELAKQEITWIALLEALIAEEVAPEHDSSPRDIAEFVFSASKNAKYGAEDRAHMARRLTTIKTAAMAMIKA